MTGVVLGALALLIALVAAYYAFDARRVAVLCVPNHIQKAVADLSDRVQAAEENVTSFRATQVSWAAEIEGVLTAVEDALGRVDTKRRSTASKLSRIEQAERAATEDEPPDSDAALAQRAGQLWGAS